MNKTKLISSLGGAIAVSLLAGPLAQATEDPFSLQKVTNATHLAEAGDKSAEGKCSDGKCGDKMKEGGCNGSMDKMEEGKCSDGTCGDKMKEGGCSDSTAEPDTAQ